MKLRSRISLRILTGTQKSCRPATNQHRDYGARFIARFDAEGPNLPAGVYEENLISLRDSECRTTFVTAQDNHARHPNALPEGEGANGRAATLDQIRSLLLKLTLSALAAN